MILVASLSLACVAAIISFKSIIKNNNNSIRPTPILRKSNLFSSSSGEYHKELIEKEFIHEFTDKRGNIYNPN
ncbi:MAG: hypothetical protein QXK37_02920 [Candidatus Woesearchaeota archaeon]